MTTLVLMLHGLGGTGEGLAGLGQRLQAPGLVFRAPDGPLQGPGGGRRWFHVEGVTPENRPARVQEARAGLDRLIEQHQAETGADKVVLLGFSQGAIMALDAILRGRVAEIIALAGRLAFVEEPKPLAGARALLVGGTRDRVIPAAEVAEAAQRLAATGIVCHLLQEDIGHEIGAQGLAACRAFLQ